VKEEPKEDRDQGPMPDEELGFRYSRESRIERAPESVRWLAERRDGKKSGFLRLLLSSRVNRILFFTIVALAIVYNLVPLLWGSSTTATIGSDRFVATALYSEGRIFISVKKSSPAAREATSLSLTVIPTGGRGQGSIFTMGTAREEFFRLAIDSPSEDPKSVRIFIETDRGRAELEVPVE
jgi:hypothetical protein